VTLLVVASVFAAVGASSGAASAGRSKFKVTTELGAQAPLPKGATVSRQVVWTASATGTDISRIVFSIDGVPKWTDLAAPYVFNGDQTGRLDTTALPDGKHMFGVEAYAVDGRTASATLALRVSNSSAQPPFTVTSSIADGATLNGSFAWTATPSGATVGEVDFKIDGATSWSELTVPYQFGGDPNGVLDTSTLAAGSHLLEVVATSTDDRTATAQSSVTVASAASGSPLPPSPIPSDVPSYGFSSRCSSCSERPAP
jgi:hypothetical protein